MDESTQQYYQLQNALSNQFQNLKGQSKAKYTDAVNHILNNYAEKKESAMEIYEKAKDSAEKTSEALHNISSTIEGSTLGTTLFGKGVRKLVDKVKAKKAFLKDKAQKLMQDAKDKADDLKTRVDDTVDNVKNKAGNIEENMQDKLTSVQENIENLQSKGGTIVEGYEPQFDDSMLESKTVNLDDIGSTFDSAKASTSAFEDLSSMGNEVKGVGTSALKNFGSKASDFLKNSAENIQHKISNKAEQLIGKGKQLISRVKTLGQPKEAINPYENRINPNEGLEMQPMGKSKPIEAPQTPEGEAQLTDLSKVEDVGQKIGSNIEDTTSNLKGTITQTASDLEGIANKTAQTAEDAVESAQNIGSKISKGVEGLGDILPELGEATGEGLGELGGEEVTELTAGAIGGPVGEGIALVAGLGTAIASVVSTVESIKKHINDGQSQLTKQANASVQQLQKPHADLTANSV